MNRSRRLIAVGGAVAALAAGGAAFAIAGGDDDENEKKATGPAAERAERAALAIVPGTANAVERDDEDGATWEVEVTREGGGTVDVRLDEGYREVAVEDDSESGDDDREGE